YCVRTPARRGRRAEAGQCAGRPPSLSPLDPMMYYFNSLAGMANLIAERYERAIELSNRSLRENRLHTPTLRTLAAAFVLSGRHDDARETMSRLRELEPGLTAGVLRQRYPGRDSPQAGRFIGALVEAGLPLWRDAATDTPAEIDRIAAISAGEGTSPRKMSARVALSTGTSATSALERSAPRRVMAWFSAMSATQPIKTPCQRVCQQSSSGHDRHH